MNGIHDLGGMHGFGPIAPPCGEQQPDEPVFHTATDGRTLALQVSSLGAELYNLDEFRRTRENLDPDDYLTMTYYQSWAESISRLLVEKGVLSQPQLDDRHAYFVDHPDAAPADPVLPIGPTPARRWARSFDYQRPQQDPPRFHLGDAVRARNMHPAHHTRLSRYARGKRGMIDAVYGAYIYPDCSAHGGGEDPRPLYRVRFPAVELWGPIDQDGAEAVQDAVYLDCWEPYLEPA